MTDYRRERQSYVSRAGGDEGGQDCAKRDVKKTGEEVDEKKKTGDRGGWRKIADEAVKSCRQHLTPDKGKKRKREIPHIRKPAKAHFIRVCTLFSQKYMYINTFQLGGGGHIGFLNFEAFAAICELGIQKIWAQHPSIPIKSLYALN